MTALNQRDIRHIIDRQKHHQHYIKGTANCDKYYVNNVLSSPKLL